MKTSEINPQKHYGFIAKNIDPLTLDFIIGFVGIALFIYGLFKEQTKFTTIGSALVVLSSVLFAYIVKYGTAKIVENRFNGNLYIKPENGTLDSINYGILKNIDGIQAGTAKNKVFKFRNGTNIIIDENGTPQAANPFSNAISRKLVPLSELDENWKPLFEKISL